MSFERDIDFARPRLLHCNKCGHQDEFSHPWIDLWEQGKQGCPSCGITSDHPLRATYTYSPSDLAVDNTLISTLHWYHTTTHENWPNPNFDPLTTLTQESQERMELMCGKGASARWARKQKLKALHVGTFEAAIENMLRRIQNQPAPQSQYYLYRVHLCSSNKVVEGINCEPTNFTGDAYLPDLGLKPSAAYRYVNVHEDPGSISLALGIESIESVQKLALPLLPPTSSESQEIERALDAAELESPVEIKDIFSKYRRTPNFTDPYALMADAQWNKLALQLPDRLQRPFQGALDLKLKGSGNDAVSRHMIGMSDIILKPEKILQALETIAAKKIEL